MTSPAGGGLLLMALGGMEATYLWAALALLNGWAAGGQLHPLWLVPLYAVGAGLGWSLAPLWRPLRYSAAAAGAALALLLTIYWHFYTGQPLGDAGWLGSLLSVFNPVTAPGFPAQGVAVGMGLVLVWRGWALADTRPDETACLVRFQMGAAVFLLVFLAASQTGVKVEPWLWPVLVFVALSLGGLGLARGGGGRAWGTARGMWGAVLAGAVLLVVLSGLAAAAWLSPEVLRWPLRGLKALGMLLMAVVDWLMGLLPTPEVPEVPEGSPPMDVIAAEAEVTRMFALPEWLRRLLRGALMVLMLGLVMGALASVSAQVWGRLRRGLAGDAEPMPGAFRADLVSWLRGVRDWLWRAVRRRGGVRGSTPLTSPRQVYRSLLHHGAQAGWPRLPAQTPLEYQATLATALRQAQGSALPSGHEALNAITAAYIQARYAPAPPTPAQGRQVAEEWHRLRPLLRRRRLQAAPLSPNMGQEAGDR